MIITPVNYNTNFKSAIPVVYWEKIGKQYKLVDNLKDVQRMQDILVRRANGTGSKAPRALRERKMVMDLLREKDRDYEIEYDKYKIPGFLKVAEKLVGSFYHKQGHTGWEYGRFNPFVMLMTGLDKETMNDMGRGIGIELKKRSPKELVDQAKDNFVAKGKKLSARSTEEELHVIVEKIKNRGYRIIKLDMYPKEGPKSPYTIMHYYD